jgi:hypothetical protein
MGFKSFKMKKISSLRIQGEIPKSGRNSWRIIILEERILRSPPPLLSEG